MLRSCYKTKARFYSDDSIQDDITWQFVADDTPFLPIPSAIVSNNWREQRGLVDDSYAGEVVGVPRPYFKGFHDITLDASGYTGSTADFLGNGVRPSVPPPRNMFGNLVGCRDDSGLVLASVDVYFLDLSGGLAPEPVEDFIVRSSEWSYEILASLMTAGTPNQPWSVDLYYANPNGSGTNDFLTDFSICSFPGYSSQMMYPTIINPATMTLGEEMDNTLVWTMTDFPAPGDHPEVMGVVASDSSGTVLFYLQLVSIAIFGFPGCQFTPTVAMVAACDYP